MSFSNYRDSAIIVVSELSADVDPLLHGFTVEQESGVTRLLTADEPMPSFVDAAHALADVPWIDTVTLEDGCVQFVKDGAVIAEARHPDDQMSVMDIAAVIEQDTNSTLHSAVVTTCWDDGDTGGCVDFYATHFQHYTDTEEVADDYVAIDTRLGEENFSEVADIITRRTKDLLLGIRSDAQRTAVASELKSALVDMCQSFIPQDSDTD